MMSYVSSSRYLCVDLGSELMAFPGHTNLLFENLEARPNFMKDTFS